MDVMSTYMGGGYGACMGIRHLKIRWGPGSGSNDADQWLRALNSQACICRSMGGSPGLCVNDADPGPRCPLGSGLGFRRSRLTTPITPFFTGESRRHGRGSRCRGPGMSCTLATILATTLAPVLRGLEKASHPIAGSRRCSSWELYDYRNRFSCIPVYIVSPTRIANPAPCRDLIHNPNPKLQECTLKTETQTAKCQSNPNPNPIPDSKIWDYTLTHFSGRCG